MQGNSCVDLPTGKNEKNKGFGFTLMSNHVQKELLKLHGIENMGLLQNRLTEPRTQGSTTEVVNASSENNDFIRANTVPGNKSYADVAMSGKTKIGITKKVIVLGDSIIQGIRVRDFNQQVKNRF